MSNLKPPPIYKLVTSQFATAFLFAVILLVITDKTVAYSAFIGGLICAIANSYFAIKAFAYTGANATPKIVKAVYLGEFVKLLLIAAGFAVAFVFVNPLNIVLLFTGFGIVHLVGIIAAIGLQSALGANQQRNFKDS